MSTSDYRPTTSAECGIPAQGSRRPALVAHSRKPVYGTRCDRLDREEVSEIVVTDTVPQAATGWRKERVVPAAPLIADAIHQFVIDGSLGRLR